MKSSVNFFRIHLFDSRFIDFDSLSEVSHFIEKMNTPVSYDGELLECRNSDGYLLFLLRISVSVLFKSDYDDFTVYSINYSLFDV